MNLRLGKLHVLATAALAIVSSASATVLNFDDLPGQGDIGVVVTDYQGFYWSGWAAFNQSDYQEIYHNNYSVPSAPNFVGNGMGDLTVRTERMAGLGLFNFIGADVSTWAYYDAFDSWYSSTTLTVDGYNGATLVGSVTWNLSSTMFETKTANLMGVDSLVFSSDGTDRWWILDNFNYSTTAVPEPSTCIAGALLLLPFGLQGIRLLRNRKS